MRYHWIHTGLELKYKIWSPDFNESEDDAIVIEALDEPSAVEMWAEGRDRTFSTYPIADGNARIQVTVRNVVSNQLTKWIVGGETLRTYMAVSLELFEYRLEE